MAEDRKHTFSSVFYLIYYTFSSDLFPLDCADPNKSPRQHYGQYHGPCDLYGFFYTAPVTGSISKEKEGYEEHHHIALI
ncbi:MAG: hypothetical protein IKH68_00855, partial [Erysipelotrichaceae bacterium]|nr:hypothetical protein [Erysipelotrichaceae bacterium]